MAVCVLHFKPSLDAVRRHKFNKALRASLSLARAVAALLFALLAAR